MDECYFCGFQYHPMPVYTLGPGADIRAEDGNVKPYRIRVCHIGTDSEGNSVTAQECRQQAEKLGYVYRRDLTPTR